MARMVGCGGHLSRPDPPSSIRRDPPVSEGRNGRDRIARVAIVLGLSFNQAIWTLGFVAILVVVVAFV